MRTIRQKQSSLSMLWSKSFCLRHFVLPSVSVEVKRE